MSTLNVIESLSEECAEFDDGTLYRSDARALLSELDSEIADIVFLDPPFNLGKRYGTHPAKEDRDSEVDYWQFLTEVLREGVRILKQGGAIYIYHLPKWAIKIGAKLHDQLEFRHWIAVSMKNGFVGRNVLYPAHYALLYFTKGEAAAAERPKISPERCRNCNRFVKDYGGYKDLIKENGVSLSDMWVDLSPVRHAANKHRDANELAEGIPARVVEISGIEDGLFVDPFVGSGTALIKAREAGMMFIGGDSDEESFEVSKRRLEG